MSENFPNFNELAKSPFPECHWRWCCQFMDRCRNLVLPAEQLLALGHIFANARLVLRGNADHTMALVLDLVREQLPPATEVDQVENRCWEREAEPEFPVDDAEVQEPGEESNSDCFEVEGFQMDIIDLCSDIEMDSAQPEEGQPVPELRIDPANVSTSDPETAVEREEMVEATVSEPECSKGEMKQTSPKYNPIHPSSFTSGESITLDSVCRDLVLFDDDFFKTLKYYNRISRAQLKLTVKEGSILGETLATIHVDQLVLSQATVMDRTKTIQEASKQFIQAMKNRCYSVETLHPKNALQRRTNLVQRLPPKTPEIDRVHYERIMRDFQARDNGCHLVFAEDFTDLECGVMQGIAARLELPGRLYDLPAGRKRFLVLAQELPPQEIVRRIVTERDAELGFQYRVSPPQRMANSQEVVTAGKPSAGAGTSGLACGSSKPKPMKKSVKLPVTFACLTKFAPVKTLQSIDDVYRNLVLIGTDFEKTAKAFHKTKVGILKLSTSEYLKGGFNATVQVGKFLLVEARNITKNLAKFNAKAMFFKKAEMYCYQIIKKQTAATEVLVTKREIPDSNQCKRFLEDFNKNSIEKELVFSAEFNKADLANFISIAKSLTMKVCPPEMDKHRRLRIVGHRLPALVIVERIVLANDPFLGGIYQVVPPKSGA